MEHRQSRCLVTLFAIFITAAILNAGFLFSDSEKTYGEGVVLNSIDINSFNNEFAQTKDKIVKKPYMLIEFFTLHCQYCKDNILHLNRLNKNSKIAVVGYINANSKKVRAYARKHSVEFTIARASKEYMKLFNPVAMPMSFLIDTKTLKVKKSFIGKLTEQDVLDEI